jgi:myb proto-oncogene protein
MERCLGSKHRHAEWTYGKWVEDEDSMLKDAVQTHGDKNWAVLVHGRTGKRCHNRWRSVLDPSIDRANGRTGKWTEDEDSKLREAVQMHGSKNWDAIAQLLVPGRTKIQCRSSWRKRLDPNRSTVRGKGHSALNKAPALEQDSNFS